MQIRILPSGLACLFPLFFACGDEGGGGGSTAPLTEIGSIGPISEVNNGASLPAIFIRYDITKTWAWLSIAEKGNYVINLETSELLSGCGDDGNLPIGLLQHGQDGSSAVLSAYENSEGNTLFRVVDNVLEAIHESGVGRCQLTTDLEAEGTRLDSVPFDITTAVSVVRSSSRVTRDGIWLNPPRRLNYDGTVTDGRAPNTSS